MLEQKSISERLASGLAVILTDRQTGEDWDRLKTRVNRLIDIATSRTFYVGERSITASIRSELGRIAMGAEYIAQRLQRESLPPPIQLSY